MPTTAVASALGMGELTWRLDLAAVVLAQREYAVLNERAFIRRPLSEAEYLAAPYVAEPFHRAYCTSEIDGACAFVVTSLERARDLATHPVVVEGASWVTSRGARLDMGDFQSYKDYLHIAQVEIGRRLWADSGMTPGDIDVAMLYDAFSSTVLMGLESLGFAGRGPTREGSASPGYPAAGSP